MNSHHHMSVSLASLAATCTFCSAQPFAIEWSTIDSGGAADISAGSFQLGGAIGQPDAGLLNAAPYDCLGGFWNDSETTTPPGCYPNCDGSTGAPRLTANDFQCFINAYAAGSPYANCDGSTGTPALTANDFQCFINTYAAGCT